MGKYKKYRKEARNYAKEVSNERNDEDNKSDRNEDDDEQDHSTEDPRSYYKSSLSSSKQQEKEQKIPCSWDRYRTSLRKMFFTESEIISGEKEEEDFWAFLRKYEAFQKKRGQNKSYKDEDNSRKLSKKFSLPLNYEKKFKMNYSLSRHALKYLAVSQRDYDRGLTDEKIKEFKQILLYYVDFCQKAKFAKVQKLREDQRNLPIFAYKEKILEEIKQNQVVVVAGDTGCGKSTQIPQYLLEAGYSNIACTQPRRIACISLSKRVGYETFNEYRTQVAYQVRFEKSRTKATRILFLTEGLLLRQLQNDPLLSQYSVVVIDEVHERHIHTDFLLGIMRCIMLQRTDLKIVLMSATINIDLFSSYFEDCPVLRVPGRLYPITLNYKPIGIEEKASRSERLNPGPYIRILQLIDHKYPANERGDLLMFLSGMAEIMAVVEAARAYSEHNKRWIILPLHSSLSIEEQDKVFDIAPDGVRKCIVSTNIAETSVTIDGVRFVVDSGKVKEMSYDSKCSMQKLQEFWISRASAEQRKGRAGRTGPGVCYRLYAESDYDAFQEYSTPEIRRVPLESLILQMCAMGLTDPHKFPFIEPPDSASIENSVVFLKEQKALTENDVLTPIGQMLSQLPVDVVMGKMLIMGSIFRMIDPVLTVAAALSIQSPFTSRAHTDLEATEARKDLESDHGDPFVLLNLYDAWLEIKAEGSQTKKWCKRRGLEEQRFYELSKLRKQFQQLLQDHQLMPKDISESNEYMTADERKKKHAERRMLHKLKRKEQQSSRKRKILKLEDDRYELSENEGDKDENSGDIRDIEFRLTHNLDKLQSSSARKRKLTARDYNLLKIIISSGLYPQMAIADNHNNFKPNSEQAFHTKNKQFVLLHPTGTFSSNPEVLQLKHHDIKKGLNKKDLYSNSHQLLAYVSLLETTKPYLMGTMRVPALQTLLLFASSIDTNSNCSRILCDGWMELKIEDVSAAQKLVTNVVALRNTWLKLIQMKLDDAWNKTEQDTIVYRKMKKLQEILTEKLGDFLSCDISYCIRRVFVAELKISYRGPEEDFSDINTENKPIHPLKGGIRVNDYWTHACLLEDSNSSADLTRSYMKNLWTCPSCNHDFAFNVLQRVSHEEDCCKSKEEEACNELEDKLRQEGHEKLRKNFECDKCQKEFNFTTIEALKHRKLCSIDN
ncbi:DgyrCDS12547 [Dimorphilus gyrociliatus]|uniref:DgyrCDS12547 n=1 Tax=Dimorphilus gyrociliatus TaxID=2664684 RepID=A0A7I8W7L4_9ANNE|nr:DgyrCDS12547 [Dimorphilus gyrociliatus]